MNVEKNNTLDIIIETQRLILRKWRDADLQPMAEINQDPQVMEHFPAPKTFEETRNFIAGNRVLYEQVGYFIYAVESKETHELIGFVGLQPVGIEMTPGTQSCVKVTLSCLSSC